MHCSLINPSLAIILCMLVSLIAMMPSTIDMLIDAQGTSNSHRSYQSAAAIRIPNTLHDKRRGLRGNGMQAARTNDDGIGKDDAGTIAPSTFRSEVPSGSPIESKDDSTESPVESFSTRTPSHSPARSLQTTKPTSEQSARPTIKMPTKRPSKAPITRAPTKDPTTSKPTNKPSSKPTSPPTRTPTTKNPTKVPTATPTNDPTTTPTKKPTESPTISPSNSPTSSPSKKPSNAPTLSPTVNDCPPGNYYHGSQKDCQFLKLDIRPYTDRYLSSLSKFKDFAPQSGVCSTLRTIVSGNKRCWMNGNSAIFGEAKELCERDGLRLCTNSELQFGYGLPRKGSDDEINCYDKSYRFWTSTPCSLKVSSSQTIPGRLIQKLDGSMAICKDENDRSPEGSTANRVVCCADSIVYEDVHDRPCIGCVSGSTSVISSFLLPATGEVSCIAGAVKAPTSVDNHFTASPTIPKVQKPNVLLIVVDDLKAGLVGGFNPSTKSAKQTPNIDALMKRGISFANAHAQQAECGPSRASFLTGKRPDYVGVTDFITGMRDRFPDLVTLPQLLKNNGYRTVIGYGKVFDGRISDGDTVQDFPLSWTRRIYNPFDQQTDYITDKAILGDCGYKDPDSKTAMTQCAQFGDDTTYMDGKYADQATYALDPQSLLLHSPWFLAVGFAKPHLPFVAPGSYWSKYERNEFSNQVKEDHEDKGTPVDAYDFAHSDNNEISKYDGYPTAAKGISDPPDSVRLRVYHGYYAATSYVDAQVGKVVEGLKQRPIEEQQNTLIVLLGDHGFHLGDHDMYAKATIYEDATRTPLVIVPPTVAKEYDSARGKISGAPVELIDVLPTIADLTRVLDRGTCDKNPKDCLVPDVDGTSLKPILLDPVSHAGLSKFALSQARGYSKDKIVSYALRTWRYRYVVHMTDMITSNGKIIGRELYDYIADPRARKNLYKEPSYASVVTELERAFQNSKSLRWLSIKGSAPFDAVAAYNSSMPSSN